MVSQSGELRIRGTAPFPVKGRDLGRKTVLPIRGGIKMGDGKGGGMKT